MTIVNQVLGGINSLTLVLPPPGRLKGDLHTLPLTLSLSLLESLHPWVKSESIGFTSLVREEREEGSVCACILSTYGGKDGEEGELTYG